MLRGAANKARASCGKGYPIAFKGLTREARARVPADRARMEGAFSRYFRAAGSRDRWSSWYTTPISSAFCCAGLSTIRRTMAPET
jgi:hypothetical protein